MSKIKEKITNIESKCCSNPNIQSDKVQMVCFSCGITFGPKLTYYQTRTFNAQQKNKRIHNERVYSRLKNRTIISTSRKDGYGNPIISKDNNLFHRLTKINNSSNGNKDRNFTIAYPILKSLGAALNCPDYIKKFAWKLYIMCYDKRLIQGRSIAGFIAASFFLASRSHKYPYFIDEIVEVVHNEIDKKSITKAISNIVRNIFPEIGLKYIPITIEAIISRASNLLKLPVEAQLNAISLLDKATKNGFRIGGNDPKSIASSLIYMAGLKLIYCKKTQKEISKVLKQTDTSLRNANRLLKGFL